MLQNSLRVLLVRWKHFTTHDFFPVPNSMPIEGLSLANYHSTTEIDYMCSLRPICEVLFYFLLLTYGAGVRACKLRSVGDGICPRESRQPCIFSPIARNECCNCGNHSRLCGWWRDGTCSRMPEAKVCNFVLLFPVTEPIDLLKCSIEAIPASHKKDRNFLSSWDEEQLKFCWRWDRLFALLVVCDVLTTGSWTYCFQIFPLE